MFSSVAARTGNLGQCDYAMANEVLNLVAASERARRGAACAVRSIGWGPWAGGMVTPSLEKHFAQMGVPLIPLDVGARMFVDELQGGGGEVTIVVGGAAGGGPLGAEAARAVSLELRVDAASHPLPRGPPDRGDGGGAGGDGDRVDPARRPRRAPRSRVRLGARRQGAAPAQARALRSRRRPRPRALPAGRRGQRPRGDLRRAARPGRRAALSRGGRDGAPAAGGPADAVGAAARGLRRVRPLRRARALPRPALPGDPRRGRDLARGDRRHASREARRAGGRRDGWRTDPALLDGGLQLALVWARHVLGGASLPMAVRELRSYREGLAEGPVRCVVSARETREVRAVCDVVFTDASGAVVAELLGVETVQRPRAGDEPEAAATAVG